MRSALFALVGIIFLFLAGLLSGLWPNIASFHIYDFWDAVGTVFFLLSGIVFLGVGVVDDDHPMSYTEWYLVNWLIVYVMEVYVAVIAIVGVSVVFFFIWLFSVAMSLAILLLAVIVIALTCLLLFGR